MAVFGYLDTGVRARPQDDPVYSLFLLDSVSGAQLGQITLESQAFNGGFGSLSRDGATIAFKGVADSFVYFCDTATGNIRTTPVSDYINVNQYGFGPDGTFYMGVFSTPSVLISIPKPYTSPTYTTVQGNRLTDFSVTGVQDLIITTDSDPGTGLATGIFRLDAATGAISPYIDIFQTSWAYGDFTGATVTADARFMALSPRYTQTSIATFDVDSVAMTSYDATGSAQPKTLGAGFSGDSSKLVYRYNATSLATRYLVGSTLATRDFQVQLDDSAQGVSAADYVLVGMVDDSHALLHNRGLLAVIHIDTGVVTTRFNRRNQGVGETDGLPIVYKGLGIGGPPPEPAGFWQDFVKATEVA